MTTQRSRSLDHFEQIATCDDKASGLRAVIVIHSTRRGPALGGCRMWPFPTERDAINDAKRLARGMTFKAALTDLPLGGGKSVIIGDPRADKSPQLLRAFGAFVDSMQGRYVTGEDVGTSVADMEFVAESTAHVAGRAEGSGDPSPVTARGVFMGIRAAVRHRYGDESLSELTVAVQGIGHVGYDLCALLHDAGANLIISDINANACGKAKSAFGAAVVPIDQISASKAHIFAPCALGAVINDDTLPQLDVDIVAGAANNQLAEPRHGAALHAKRILFAPDYVINAGGLMNVAWDVLHAGETYDQDRVMRDVERIDGRLSEIFAQSQKYDRPTDVVADAMAKKVLDNTS